MHLQDDYNTARGTLELPEYGRIVQKLVQHINTMPSKLERTRMATGVVSIMLHLNPHMREQQDVKHILWDHLHIMSGYTLDVDGPYDLPLKEEVDKQPERIQYNDSLIKFRFYGRNLQLMVMKASEMENGPLKSDFINMIASFMFNSCRNWNNENLGNDVLAEHMLALSKGKLVVRGEDLHISAEQQVFQKKPFVNFKKNNKNRPNNKFRPNKGFRKY